MGRGLEESKEGSYAPTAARQRASKRRRTAVGSGREESLSSHSVGGHGSQDFVSGSPTTEEAIVVEERKSSGSLDAAAAAELSSLLPTPRARGTSAAAATPAAAESLPQQKLHSSSPAGVPAVSRSNHVGVLTGSQLQSESAAQAACHAVIAANSCAAAVASAAAGMLPPTFAATKPTLAPSGVVAAVKAQQQQPRQRSQQAQHAQQLQRHQWQLQNCWQPAIAIDQQVPGDSAGCQPVGRAPGLSWHAAATHNRFGGSSHSLPLPLPRTAAAALGPRTLQQGQQHQRSHQVTLPHYHSLPPLHQQPKDQQQQQLSPPQQQRSGPRTQHLQQWLPALKPAAADAQRRQFVAQKYNTSQQRFVAVGLAGDATKGTSQEIGMRRRQQPDDPPPAQLPDLPLPAAATTARATCDKGCRCVIDSNSDGSSATAADLSPAGALPPVSKTQPYPGMHCGPTISQRREGFLWEFLSGWAEEDPFDRLLQARHW